MERAMNSNEMIEVLLSMMERQNQGHAQEMAKLLNESIQFIQETGQQIQTLSEQLRQTQQQLDQLKNTKNPAFIGGIQNMAVDLKNNVAESAAMLHDIKISIKESVEKGIENFKMSGKTKLNSLFKFCGLEDKLNKLKDMISGISSKLQLLQDKIESVGKEFKEAANHVKNIGRIIGGKEMKESPDKEGTKLTDFLRKTCKGMKKTAAGCSARIDKAIARVRNLDQTVERYEKNPSVLGKIEKFKATADKTPKQDKAMNKSRNAAISL